MKKVIVSMWAVVEYGVVVEVSDDATDDMILDAAESIADHETDVSDFNWKRKGSWYYGNSPAYDIEDVED